jgi:hypothetical protein
LEGGVKVDKEFIDILLQKAEGAFSQEDFKEFEEKVLDAFKMKNRHFIEVIEKVEKVDNLEVVKKMLNKYKEFLLERN